MNELPAKLNATRAVSDRRRVSARRVAGARIEVMKMINTAVSLMAAPLLFAQGVSITHAVTPIPEKVTRTRTALTAKLADSARAKLQRVATAVAPKSDASSSPEKFDAAIRNALGESFPGANLGAGESDALVFVIATDIAKENDVALRDLSAEVEKMAKQKDDIRKRLAATKTADAKPAARPGVSLATAKVSTTGAIKAPAPLAADASAAAVQDRLDQLNQLGEMSQLRLQMMTDRRSKAMAVLSNLMKKVSETDSSILSNLK
jgi:hypothetical protein